MSSLAKYTWIALLASFCIMGAHAMALPLPPKCVKHFWVQCGYVNEADASARKLARPRLSPITHSCDGVARSYTVSSTVNYQRLNISAGAAIYLRVAADRDFNNILGQIKQAASASRTSASLRIPCTPILRLAAYNTEAECRTGTVQSTTASELVAEEAPNNRFGKAPQLLGSPFRVGIVRTAPSVTLLLATRASSSFTASDGNRCIQVTWSGYPPVKFISRRILELVSGQGVIGATNLIGRFGSIAADGTFSDQ